MSQYFILVTKKKVAKTAAKKIDQLIKEIDSTASFVAPLSIPGSEVKGWLERPNDGTNDYNHARERNLRMAAIVRRELELEQ